MCWRGHDPRRVNAWGVCRDCHAIRVRAIRGGRQARHMPTYGLDVAAFNRLRRRPINIVIELSGLSYNTAKEWLYRGVRAKLNGARALAEGMGVPFEWLWH